MRIKNLNLWFSSALFLYIGNGSALHASYSISSGTLFYTTTLFSIKDIVAAKKAASVLNYNRLINSQSVTNIINGHSLSNNKDGSYFLTNSKANISNIIDAVIQKATHYDFDISNSSKKPFLSLWYDFSSETISSYVNNPSHIGHDLSISANTNGVVVCFGFGNPPSLNDIRVLTAYPSNSPGACHK